MHYRNIRISFYLALLAITFVRFLHFFLALDPVTGFLKPDYKLIGFGLLVLTFVIAFTITGISFTIKRCPIKVPRLSYLSGAFSFALSISIVYDLLKIENSANIPHWQTLLLKVTGGLAALFFVLLFVKSLKNFNLPDFFFVAPVLYYLIRLIYLFTASSVIALISDNILYLATHIFTLLFMLELCVAKFQEGQNKNFKKVAATGFTAVLLSVATCVPHLIAWSIKSPASQRVDFSDAAVTLLTGLFLLSFLSNYFSGHNVLARRHRQYNPEEEKQPTNDFYTG